MNKTIYLFLFFLLLANCSLNKNSKFWTSSEKINEEKIEKFKEIFSKEKALSNELNPNLKIRLSAQSSNNNTTKYYLNNDGKVDFDLILEKSSRYKFSKIKNFYQYEPTISFYRNNIIFFDNKGSLLQFDNKSKLIWKKNYYTKVEKKLNPILQLANNNKFLIVADNIAKSYMLDLKNGNLIWSKDNLAPFNSQIKMYKDKFFIIDFSNTLRCFSIKNGNELWNVKTENSLIRSQKKLSLIILNDIIYFNNSIGDISAVDIKNGDLLWQLPTQSSLIYEAGFSLETSDIIANQNTLFFSNNKNQFFSIDVETGSFNWENKINSNLRPTLVDDYLFSVSLEGYLIIIDKNSGNIIRVTDVFTNFKPKKRDQIKPTGFIVGLSKIYLSTNIGKLLVIDISTGKTISSLKIDKEKISRPFVLNNNLFIIKDNAIIKLN